MPTVSSAAATLPQEMLRLIHSEASKPLLTPSAQAPGGRRRAPRRGTIVHILTDFCWNFICLLCIFVTSRVRELQLVSYLIGFVWRDELSYDFWGTHVQPEIGEFSHVIC